MPRSGSQAIEDPARLEAVWRASQRPQATFDRLVEAVRLALGVPVALVSLVESGRQVFVGAAGLPEPWSTRRETPLSHSFCRLGVVDRQPLIVADAREDERVAGNPAIRELSVIAYAGWPLVTREGTVLGSLCAIDSQPREWGPDDLRFLELCAETTMELIEARADVSDERRGGEERKELLRALQVRLLPRELPAARGLELAASFRPAGGDVLVGGDFYDVFPAPDGGLLAVVGDVCGKGPEAAAIGATVRSLLRGAGRHSVDLVRLAEMVNDELYGQVDGRFVTLVLAHISPDTRLPRRARVAVAGHEPPAVLRAGGSTEVVGAVGQLLGIFTDVSVGATDVELGDGDAMVVWTDGLTEIAIRDGRPADDVDVAAALRASAGGTAAQLITALEDAAGLLDQDADTRFDDVAIVAVRAVASVQAAPPDVPPGWAPDDLGVVAAVEGDFRRLNEEVEHGRPDGAPVLGLLCECGHPSCRQTLSVPREDYERLRGVEDVHLIVPTHDLPAAEDVVERHPEFWVVRKRA